MPDREQIQAFLRSIGLEGWADSAEHLAGVERILAVLREPNRAAIEVGKRELGTDDHRPLGPLWRLMLDARFPPHDGGGEVAGRDSRLVIVVASVGNCITDLGGGEVAGRIYSRQLRAFGPASAALRQSCAPGTDSNRCTPFGTPALGIEPSFHAAATSLPHHH